MDQHASHLRLPQDRGHAGQIDYHLSYRRRAEPHLADQGNREKIDLPYSRRCESTFWLVHSEAEGGVSSSRIVLAATDHCSRHACLCDGTVT